MAAFVLLGIIIVLTLAGPWVAQQAFGLDPYRQTLPRRYQPPSPTNPYGTDDLGRDVLARTLIAGRVSFTIGMTVAIVSLVIGIPVGLASGYFGGRFDDVSNAVIQTLANIPSMFLLILLVATRSARPVHAGGHHRAAGWMGTARLVRGMALSVREREYVQAAAGARRLERADHLPPPAPERLLAGHGDRRLRRRRRHPGRVGPELPGAGRPAAGRLLGQHARRRRWRT